MLGTGINENILCRECTSEAEDFHLQYKKLVSIDLVTSDSLVAFEVKGSSSEVYVQISNGKYPYYLPKIYNLSLVWGFIYLFTF